MQPFAGGRLTPYNAFKPFFPSKKYLWFGVNVYAYGSSRIICMAYFNQMASLCCAPNVTKFKLSVGVNLIYMTEQLKHKKMGHLASIHIFYTSIRTA